jgi:hypothetical protein
MIDRATQRRILECLREHYPAGALPVTDLDLTEQQAAANLKYLEEFGLCDSGVDTLDIEGSCPNRLEQLRDELTGRCYQPLPARRQEIPKDGGKVRVLSIPAIRDRVVQGARTSRLQRANNP